MSLDYLCGKADYWVRWYLIVCDLLNIFDVYSLVVFWGKVVFYIGIFNVLNIVLLGLKNNCLVNSLVEII